jgi:hypothetical protein
MVYQVDLGIQLYLIYPSVSKCVENSLPISQIVGKSTFERLNDII